MEIAVNKEINDTYLILEVHGLGLGGEKPYTRLIVGVRLYCPVQL